MSEHAIAVEEAFRESYSLVDVESGVAEQVMDQLSGVRIKGREVIARPDRKE